MDAYDAMNATWSTNCLHLPLACAWGAAASLDRNIYVMGGSNDRHDPASENCMVYMPDRPASDTGDCWYQVRTVLPLEPFKQFAWAAAAALKHTLEACNTVTALWASTASCAA